MSVKKLARLRRAKKARGRIARLATTPRLSVHRTSQHIYAQVLTAKGDKVLAQASSLEKDFKGAKSSNIEGAKAVGTMIAERAKKAGVDKVAFDRSGFVYHGRVKALADAARDGGIEF